MPFSLVLFNFLSLSCVREKASEFWPNLRAKCVQKFPTLFLGSQQRQFHPFSSHQIFQIPNIMIIVPKRSYYVPFHIPISTNTKPSHSSHSLKKHNTLFLFHYFIAKVSIFITTFNILHHKTVLFSENQWLLLQI